MNSKKAKVPALTSEEEDYGDRWSRLIWNNDLLMEILVLLPAKSVTRCKLVCKHWLSLVSSDEFIRLHTLRCLKLRTSLLLELRTDTSLFFKFDPIMNGEEQMIPYTFPVPKPIFVNSCNGLMLLIYHHTEKSFIVYNPTTKLSRKISFTDTYSDNNSYILTLALAFDPSESPHYKVVCLRSTTGLRTYSYKTHTYQIEVYDSESRTWKLRLGSFTFRRLFMPHSGEGVYCNGSIYWTVSNFIVYYDISHNQFKTLALPNYPPIQPELRGFASCIQEANGRLYQSRLVLYEHCQTITLFELEMDDDRSPSWILRHDETILPSWLSSHHGYPLQLRFIMASYGTEMCCVVSYICGKINIYSFLDKSYKLFVDLMIQPFNMEEDDEVPNLEMCEFVECLAVV